MKKAESEIIATLLHRLERTFLSLFFCILQLLLFELHCPEKSKDYLSLNVFQGKCVEVTYSYKTCE